MDIGLGLAILGSKDFILRLFGPSADYVGSELQALVELQVTNIKRVLGKARAKLGSAIDNPGSIPPRVIKAVFEEAAFTEDELGAEYLGGVLASSRSGVDRDDRGVTIVNTIRSMSTYQLRLHYLIYRLIRERFVGSAWRLAESTGRSATGIVIPFDTFERAMAFEDGEDRGEILTHAVVGLVARELIGPVTYGMEPAALQALVRGSKVGGLAVQPSTAGAELYLWAHGSRSSADAFFDAAVPLELPDFDIDIGACLTFTEAMYPPTGPADEQ